MRYVFETTLGAHYSELWFSEIYTDVMKIGRN